MANDSLDGATATLWEVERPTADLIGSRGMHRLMARVRAEMPTEASDLDVSDRLDDFRAVSVKIDAGLEVFFIMAVIDTRDVSPADIAPVGLARCEILINAAHDAISKLKRGAAA